MIADKVRAYLKEAPANRLALPFAAGCIGMSTSTMAQKLREEGTNFLTLRDSERRARAVALLSRNRHADSVALMRVTGYGPASASRAVKRWFGASLPEVRGSL